MLSFDPSALIGTLVGAGAALGGTLMSQRGERSRAHADRIWKERSTAYAGIYSWCRDFGRVVVGVEWLAEHGLSETAPMPLMEHKDLDDALVTEFRLYGSDKVVKAFDEVLPGLILFRLRDNLQRHVLPTEMADFASLAIEGNDLLAGVKALEQAIMAETRRA